MRIFLLLAACLALAIAACRPATSSPSPSASISITNLSSVQLSTPTPTPPASPAATGKHTPRPTTATAAPSSIAPSMAAPSEAPSPTPAGTGPLTVATPFDACVNGWLAPGPASAEYQAALDMMDGEMDVTGDWAIDEMRYFSGPDVPWIIDPHYDVVDYWYVKGTLTTQPGFDGRWLLEQRTDLIRGVSAVAPYTSSGYQSPDWTGFTGDGSPQSYLGLPGEWAGVPYDFVTGEGDSGEPGLPDQVIGCLAGT